MTTLTMNVPVPTSTLVAIVLGVGRDHVSRATVYAIEGSTVTIMVGGHDGRVWQDQLFAIEDAVGRCGRVPRPIRIELVSGSPGEAASPKVRPATLLPLADLYPAEVLANPLLDLLSLSDPALWGSIVERAEKALSEQGRALVAGGAAR